MLVVLARYWQSIVVRVFGETASARETWLCCSLPGFRMECGIDSFDPWVTDTDRYDQWTRLPRSRLAARSSRK